MVHLVIPSAATNHSPEPRRMGQVLVTERPINDRGAMEDSIMSTSKTDTLVNLLNQGVLATRGTAELLSLAANAVVASEPIPDDVIAVLQDRGVAAVRALLDDETARQLDAALRQWQARHGRPAVGKRLAAAG
jgi:hypothetical protein